ncbi:MULTISPECIES: NACHT domain-containing protein [unclassified Anabaena]|uniref:NACHT domain-containing protein n=1 Tax=unclassified Anabaena TaxID=2619674 RepID=UPI0039C5E51E
MTSQGLRASPEGIKAAKTALTDKTLSQHKLAVALGITRQPVSKFFAGEPVSRSCFVQICQQLGLSWQKVVSIPDDETSEITVKHKFNNVDINALVQKVRQQRQDKITDQCGTLQLLDIAPVIPINNIYTDISVCEEISSQQWLNIADLAPEFSHKSNIHSLTEINNLNKLPGLEAVSRYSKLMVLGKPGSGKTIFLQYLATECNKGEFQPKRISIFIRLQEFAEDTQDDGELSLVKYITQEFISSGIEEKATATILTEGKALILLDGLDEVPSAYVNQMNREIRRFTQTYYKNQFVISCRIGYQNYRFPGFTQVEIVDFNNKQIEVFVKNWFVAVAHKSREAGESIGNLFFHQLNLLENRPIKELATTPILLHLICLVFRVKSELPSNPAKFYEQILNVLLVRWDEVRGIQRYQIHGDLTLEHKKKLLSQIAASTFEKESHFFEIAKVQHIIANYLKTLPNIYIDTGKWQQDMAALFKVIEVQNGLLVERSREIYSFSHLTLHEYLTAKNIVENFPYQACNNLMNHITDERWRQVFLLTMSMLPNAEDMLWAMKNKINLIVANDEKIQDLLIWLSRKSQSVATSYQAVALRAFYLVCVGRIPQEQPFKKSIFSAASTYEHKIVINDNVHTPSCDLEWAIVGNISFNPDLALDEFLTSTLICAIELNLAVESRLDDAITLDHVQALKIALHQALNLITENELKQKLQSLEKQLPHLNSNYETIYQWWQSNGKYWITNLRKILISYRDIAHDWQFNKQQIESLQQYYYANKLIIDCLNQAANINSVNKQKIQESLLLALAETNK